MDDTTAQQQPTDQPVVASDSVSSMNDVAGMTPPPAPVMPDPAMSAAAPEPAAPSAADAPAKAGGDDEYSYAEDVLNEILDSLDRIESKLEAMEKKMG